MPDISFADFGPRSFEQFAQALAAAILGPGLLIFGDGPDGGREAEHVGPVSYPNDLAPWTGRTVMQAKFRQRSTEPGDDVTWLIRQLQGEAAHYRARLRTIPDHYLLVTNIRLSGVDEPGRKGGQHKIRAAFEKHLQPLGVKDFDVWHEEKIAVLLDTAPELRKSYGAWLSSRDVLASVYRAFEAKIPAFGSVMTRYLQREFRAQRATRLQQAGHVGDAPAHLEDLFVDLPFSVGEGGGKAFARIAGALEAAPADILRALLDCIAVKMDPQTLRETWPEGVSPNRMLILGGPGQGKSTISQFLGQILRYRLLSDADPVGLAPDIAKALPAFGQRLADLALPADGLRRYPLRVDLPQFADALTAATANCSRLSLLEFLARTIAQLTSTPEIDVGILREWLGGYPFLITLDGLDEVPPSGARSEVIAAIVEFWDEVGERNADVAMTVTTRPQGYNDDLDPDLWLRLEMSRLGAERALAYAGRVALLKLPDVDRRTLVLDRLAAAAQNNATAALMVSPLQVAILFQLVDQRGTAPTDRWTLFNEYLSVVIKREQEKGLSGEVIRAHEPLIRRLLARIGLLLHAEAEQVGHAGAFLKQARLEAIAADLLDEEGFEGREQAALVAAILLAATDRLVFLEQRVEGQIAFDVRSLQEFMAAAELMSGADNEVRERLRAIAGRAHWQHVYRIAASKTFAEADTIRFRDAVLAINRELDEEGPGARAIRRGALCALDLLADGLAMMQPRYRKSLASHALDTLSVCLDPDPRLPNLLLGLGEETASNLLARYLRSELPRDRRAGWSVLIDMVRDPGDWADRLGEECWPEALDGQTDILMCRALPLEGSRTADRLAACLEQIPPTLIASYVLPRSDTRGDAIARLAERFAYLKPIFGQLSDKRIDVAILPQEDGELELSLTPMETDALRSAYIGPLTPPWEIYRLTLAFIKAPSIATATAFLRRLADPDQARLAKVMELPWPLETLRRIADGASDLPGTIAKLVANEYGDEEDWRDGEQRLREKGMRRADLDRWRDGVLLDGAIAEVGTPTGVSISFSGGARPDREWVGLMIEAALVAPPGEPQDLMRWMLGFALPRSKVNSQPPVETWLGIFGGDPATCRALDMDLVCMLDPAAFAHEPLIDFLAGIGDYANLRLAGLQDRFRETADALTDASDVDGLMVVALAIVTQDASAVRDLAVRLEPRLGSMRGTAAVRDTITALRIIRGMEPVEWTALTAGEHDSVGQHALLSVARKMERPTTGIEHAIAEIATRTKDVMSVKYTAMAVLKQMLDRRRSDLTISATWKRLGLPARLGSRILTIPLNAN